MKLAIECKKHHITYDAWDSACPECQKEYEAGDRIIRRLTCQLCDTFKASTKMYCGGPIGHLCDDCKRILEKYFVLKDKYDEFWDNMREVQSPSGTPNSLVI